MADDGTTTAPGPSLTVAAVARRLGVAPATLRTWDRRYGLGPSEHMAGSHRRYSANDVSRLLVMRRLTLEGVAPSEAARAALSSNEPVVAPTPGPTTTEVLDAYSDAVPMAPDPPALVSAATHFDNAAVRWMLARVHARDVIAWWAELVGPALQLLAERAVLERPGESAAPALEAAAFAELRSRAAVAVARQSQQAGPGAGSATTQQGAPHDGGEPAAPATVLVLPSAGGPDLLAHSLATALQAHGVRARVMSAGGEAAVAAAVQRLAPAAVLLHVGPEQEEAARADRLLAAVASRASVPLFVHREGAAPLELSGGLAVHRVRTLTGALHEVLAVVG
ncbi:MerR family transcriptional regulator [Actinotalea solisilvae]|uniref:MerR family transcriptional regulator n=1 Tax=Actinotalea solisilvae TaxID=2072922 RepID=UPI0018F10AE7|nr:MerR family transcriptional regulator [Actinotalea solisilvae]